MSVGSKLPLVRGEALHTVDWQLLQHLILLEDNALLEVHVGDPRNRRTRPVEIVLEAPSLDLTRRFPSTDLACLTPGCFWFFQRAEKGI